MLSIVAYSSTFAKETLSHEVEDAMIIFHSIPITYQTNDEHYI